MFSFYPCRWTSGQVSSLVTSEPLWPGLQNLHKWTRALAIPLCKSLLMVDSEDPSHLDGTCILVTHSLYNTWGFLGKVPTSMTSWEFLEKTLFHRDSSKPQLFAGMYPFWPKLPTSRIALGFWYQETSLTDSENIWIGISKIPGESFHHWTIIYSWVGLFSLALK